MITADQIVQCTPRVLARLKSMETLPPHGTVAGQAVASLFYEELGLPIAGPINDIDVFVSRHLPPEQRQVVYTHNSGEVPSHSSANRTIVRLDNFETENDYSHVKFIAIRAGLQVWRTYTRGLLNYTLINHPNAGNGDGSHGVDVSQTVVNGFDLNAVQVGIHLADEQVVFTPDFVEFLNTHEVKATTANTPSHTLMRLAKKVLGNELRNVTCDFDAQKAMLETALLLPSYLKPAEHIEHIGMVTQFGTKYKRLADTYAHVLPPLVAQPLSQHSVPLYAFEPPVDKHRAVLDVLQEHTRNDVNFLSNYVFVQHFPTLYAMVKNSDNNERLNLLRAAFLQDNLADGERLNLVHQALGFPPLLHNINGMDDDDQATFFHNQTCLRCPDTVASTVDQFNAFSTFERHVFRELKRHADDVLPFAHNKQATWEKWVREEGWHVLRVASHWANSAEDIAPLVAAMKAAVDSPIVASTSKNYFFNGGSPLFDAVLQLYPQTQREEVLRTLVAPMAKKWTDLNCYQCLSFHKVAFDNDVFLPELQIGAWSEESVAQMLAQQSYAPTTPIQHAIVRHMLFAVSDDSLRQDNGAIVRALLKSDNTDVLFERLSAMDNAWDADFVAAVGEGVNTQIDIFGDPLRGRADNAPKNNWERILLRKTVATVAPVRRTSRKM